MPQTQTITSELTCPYDNQGLEKYLLEYVGDDQVILYLWQNYRTVVIGKNQNAWRECKVRELADDGGYLARRISGGGAVYHDLGNLNFTFVAPAALYDKKRHQAVICAALQKLGIAAEISGRNDVTVDGRKVSGNAFYESRTCFHHGTLLISVDTAEMSRYLQVSAAKLQAKGVSSVRSRVANLNEFYPGLTPELVAQELIRAFGELYAPPQTITRQDLDQKRLAELTAEFADEDWRLGSPLPATLTLGARYPWGEIELRLTEQNARLAQLQVYTDAMEPELADQLQTLLVGRPFAARELAAAVRTGPFAATIGDDLAQLLTSETY